MADIKRTLVLRNDEKESARVPRTDQEAISRWLNLVLSIIKNSGIKEKFTSGKVLLVRLWTSLKRLSV